MLPPYMSSEAVYNSVLSLTLSFLVVISILNQQMQGEALER